MARLLDIGTRRQRVWSMFLLEGLLLGIIGGALGSAIGSGLATVINHTKIMLPPPGSTMGYLLRIMLTPSILLTTFAVSITTATFSSILPGIRASRLTVVGALAHV